MRDQRLELRVSKKERRDWNRAAQSEGLTLSQWIREVLAARLKYETLVEKYTDA